MIPPIPSYLEKSRGGRTKSGLLQKAVDLTTRSTKLLGSVDHSPLGKLIVSYFRNVELHHGARMAINQTKALYAESIRFSCGLKVIPGTPMWLSRSKDNYPLVLQAFRKPLRGSVLERRMALSYLRAFESIELAPVPNLETVTSPSEGAKGFASISSSFNLFLNQSYFVKWLRYFFNKELDQSLKTEGIPLHFSSKKGVEGPTCITAGLQSLAITDELRHLLVDFRSIFEHGD